MAVTRMSSPKMISEIQKEKILSAGDCFASLLLSPYIFVAVFQVTDVLLSGSVQWPIHAASFWLVESPAGSARLTVEICETCFYPVASVQSNKHVVCVICCFVLPSPIAVWVYISSSCRFCFCFFNSINLNQQPKLNLDSASDKWNKTRNHSSSRSLLCFYFPVLKKDNEAFDL